MVEPAGEFELTAAPPDGPIYVDGTSNADGMTMVTQEFGIFPRFGMTVGFDGSFHGPGSH